MSDEGVVLNLSNAEDLAVVLALVPNWPELSLGLDLARAADRDTYRDRIQAALDAAGEAIAAEIAVLRTLPEP